MCGFLVSFGDVLKVSLDEKALIWVDARGPDGNHHFEGSNFRGYFARLAINGALSETQPIHIGEDTYLYCNGEIYNYEKLVLKYFGREFFEKSRREGWSDVRFLARLIEKFGLSIFTELSGAYSCIVINNKDETIHAIRDGIGEKPLYYAVDKDTVFFSSSLTSVLIQLGSVKVKKDAVMQWLQFGQSVLGETLYYDVKEVLPGHILTWTKKSFLSERYWDWPESNEKRTFKDLGNFNWEDSFKNAIKEVSTSDSPIAIALSSGVDSQLVKGFLELANIGSRIKAFRLRYEDINFDEFSNKPDGRGESTSDIEIVDVLLDNNSAKLHLEWLLENLDSPVSDPALIAMSYLSKHVKPSAKVLVTGDGGDELFQGYFIQKVSKLAFLSHKAISAIAQSRYFKKATLWALCLKDEKYLSLRQKILRFLASAHLSNQYFMANAISPNYIWSLLSNEQNEDLNFRISNKLELERFLQTKNLPQLFLQKTDRGGIICGVEIRASFLIRDFVEIIMKLPSHQRKKKLLKKRLRKMNIKSEIKSKHGLGVPLASILLHFQKPDFHLDTFDIKAELFNYIFDRRSINPGFANLAWSLLLLNAHAKNIKESGVSFVY